MKIDEISQPSTWMFAQLAAGKESQAPPDPAPSPLRKAGPSAPQLAAQRQGRALAARPARARGVGSGHAAKASQEE